MKFDELTDVLKNGRSIRRSIWEPVSRSISTASERGPRTTAFYGTMLCGRDAVETYDLLMVPDPTPEIRARIAEDMQADDWEVVTR